MGPRKASEGVFEKSLMDGSTVYVTAIKKIPGYSAYSCT